MATDNSEFRSFPDTPWYLVPKLGAAVPPEAKREALEKLVTRYRPAFLKHLVVTKRIQINDAEDLAQGFITTRILERDLIAKAERSKGKLRSFLVRALQNYVEDCRRSRGRENLSAELEEGRDVPHPPPADPFDGEWARIVLTRTLDRMKAECSDKGRSHVWQVFRARVVAPIVDGTPAPSYDEMVRKYGFASPKEANHLFVNAKRTFIRLLGEVIGEYATKEEIAEEINDLKVILSSAGSDAGMAQVLAVGMGNQPIWTRDEVTALQLNESD